jgi:rRNA processing protein Krr1/Pno1
MTDDKASGQFPAVVTLNVGGVHLAASLETLRRSEDRDAGNTLAAMFSGRKTAPHRDDDGRYFIDRDGRHFHHILNYIRDGSFPVTPTDAERRELEREASFFGLTALAEHWGGTRGAISAKPTTPEKKTSAPESKPSVGSRNGVIKAFADKEKEKTKEKPSAKKAKGKGRGEDHDRESEAKLEHSIDVDAHDAAFNFQGAFLGTKGRNVRHINDACKGKVWLSGKNGEPMSARITCSSQNDLEKGIRLVSELISHIEEEYRAWSGAVDEHQEEWDRVEEIEASRPQRVEKRIDVEASDRSFEMKRRIIGPKGAHMHRICSQTKSKIMVKDDRATGNLYVVIKAESEESLEDARRAIEEHLKGLYEEHRLWREGRGEAKGQHNADRSSGKKFTNTVSVSEHDEHFPFRTKFVGFKGINVHHVQDETGAEVQFHEHESPMLVHIAANTQEAVDHATDLTEELLETVYQQYKDWQDNRETRANEVQLEKRLDVNEGDPSFGIKGRIIGKRGSNLKHIRDATGVRISVVGEDQGPLEVVITASSQDALDQAAESVETLITEVYALQDKWVAGEIGDDNPHKARGGEQVASASSSSDGRKREHTIELGEYQKAFRFRVEFLGEKGANVHHIQDETKSKLWLSDTEPKTLTISAYSDSDLERAIGMAEDLLETVDAKYYEWFQDAEENNAANKGALLRPTKSKDKEGKGKGKGKDKGKNKSKGKKDTGKSGKSGSSRDWKEQAWQSDASPSWSSSSAEKRSSWQSDSYDPRPSKWRREY